MNSILSINWDISPVIVDIFGYELRWYTLMFIASFTCGYFIYKNMLIREKKPLILLSNVLFPVALATLLGARIGHCIFYEPETYLSNIWKIFIPIDNGKFVGFHGLASHGAAIGILIGLYYYSKTNKLQYLWVLDRIVITIALAGFFIRTGNLMNSEVYGYETDLPWGFVFERAGEIVPKHPTQIYEALAYLLIFIFLYVFYFKRKPEVKDGVIFSFFLILVFGARFFIEFIKEIQSPFEKGMALDMGQLLSIPLVLAGFAILISLYRKKPAKRSK